MLDLAASPGFALHCFLFITYVVLTSAVQVARVTPSPVGDASRIFRHNAYIDSKVRGVAVNFLNHQHYHQRNVIFPPSASVFPSFASNLTTVTALFSDAGIQLQPISTVSTFKPLQISRNTSTRLSHPASVTTPIRQLALNSPPNNLSIAFGQPLSAPKRLLSSHIISGPPFGGASRTSFGGPTGIMVTASRYNSSVVTGIGNLTPPAVASAYRSRYVVGDRLHLMTNLSLSAKIDTSWENDTNNACISQVNAVKGINTNPSGISVCYNIRSLNYSTGAFDAELRLYRSATASGDWKQLRKDGVAIGMAYSDATVTRQKITWKRDLLDFQGSIMHALDSHLYTRTSDAPPALLQTMLFLGQVHNGSVLALHVQATALALLTPKITLAGITRNGTPISTQFSLQGVSFVKGLFVDPNSNMIGMSTIVIGSQEWLSNANSFSDFPISLLLVLGWSGLLFAMNGYDLLLKLKFRNEDKRRILAGSSGAMVET